MLAATRYFLMPALGFSVSLLSAATALAGGPAASFTDLQVGQMVEVDGRVIGSRLVLADEVEIKKFPRDAQIQVAIQAIEHDSKTLTMLGVKIVTSDATEVENFDDQPLQFSALRLNQVVEVEGSVAEDGTFSATQVEVVDPAEQVGATEAELEGQIQEIDASASTIVVLGIKVKITPRTDLEAE
jgi:hypothetical protein